MTPIASQSGELELVCSDFDAALELLRGAGLRLDLIYPADDPQVALLSGEGRRVRLTTRNAPALPAGLPPFRPEFVLTRAGASPGRGRAGMLYRDLIPGRLGGRYIASHITIPDGGPVADWVHFHRVRFQMIYVRAGWVRMVYEDQGDPFVMNAGDLVLQPPEIRHRVLESSDGLEVIEVSCPALHETFADPQLVLPNGTNVDRDFSGQRFLRHIAAQAPWTSFGTAEAQQTAMDRATGALADVRVVRSGGSDISFPAHDGELVLGFVLDGSAILDRGECTELCAADAFVIPPDEDWRLTGASADFRLLHVTTAHLG